MLLILWHCRYQSVEFLTFKWTKGARTMYKSILCLLKLLSLMPFLCHKKNDSYSTLNAVRYKTRPDLTQLHHFYMGKMNRYTHKSYLLKEIARITLQ